MSMMKTPRVAIVGAGLSGLGCAVELSDAGLDVTVLEASDGVGGRVRTDLIEGFRLDRGFQVLLTAYPEARRKLDYGALDLRVFFPGALIRDDGRFRRLADPLRRPAAGLATVLGGTVGLSDALRLGRLQLRVSRASRTAPGPSRTTAERLEAEGFSEKTVRRFFRPFFGGVFLDTELATSELQLEFIFRMFAAGAIAVPARGMGEISLQLAGRLPSASVRTNTPVAEARPGSVRLIGGGNLSADAVVVATDGSTACEILGLGNGPSWQSTTCLYFAADRAPISEPILVLDGEGAGPVNNLCVMSEVSNELAPPGRALISATVVGRDEVTLDAVRNHLAAWFGAEVSGWRHLKSYRIDRALPTQPAPDFDPTPRPPHLSEGLYVCGDHRADSSINGALLSGRLAAEAVLEDLE